MFSRQEVQQGISNELTNIDEDFLYSTLQSFQSSIEDIKNKILALKPGVHLKKLTQLKEDVFGKRNIFIGHTFENSTGINILFTNVFFVFWSCVYTDYFNSGHYLCRSTIIFEDMYFSIYTNSYLLVNKNLMPKKNSWQY